MTLFSQRLKDQLMSNSVDNSVCKTQNFNLLSCDIENYFFYCYDVTLPTNFQKEIMGKFLEPLQKQFLNRDLKQLSLRNVILKNVARKILRFAQFKNIKKLLL